VSALILLVLALYALLEITVATALAAVIGWTWVLVLMAALVILGVAVMRTAGMAAARSLRGATGPDGLGAPPAGTGAAVGDASLRFAAGVLIALPGLVTSAFGLLLLVPPLRRVLGVAVVGWFVARLRRRGVSVVSSYRADGSRFTRVVPGDVVEGEVVPNTSEEPTDPPQLST
jgi:UPF0716 protein FxsA